MNLKQGSSHRASARRLDQSISRTIIVTKPHRSKYLLLHHLTSCRPFHPKQSQTMKPSCFFFAVAACVPRRSRAKPFSQQRRWKDGLSYLFNLITKTFTKLSNKQMNYLRGQEVCKTQNLPESVDEGRRTQASHESHWVSRYLWRECIGRGDRRNRRGS